MTIKLTREEAIQDLKAIKSFERYARGRLALGMAIEALEGMCFDEWCDDCKEYDTEKKCCPRFNRVIRGAMNREPSEDGTLEVKVDDATKIGRVLISDDKHRGGLYYPDEYEPKGEDLISRAQVTEIFEAMLKTVTDQKIKIGISRSWQQIKDLPSADRPKDGDLISRADAIETIELVDWYHQNKNKDMIHGANSDEHQAWYKADDVYKALEAVPQSVSFENDTKIKSCSKDSDLISRAEAIEALGEEPPVWCDEEYEIAERNQWRADIEAIKSVPSAEAPRPTDSTITVDLESGVVPRSACEPRGPKTIIYADRIYSERPKGRWHYSDGKPATIGQSFGVICDQCGTESEYCTNFCGECGTDMRGEDE